MTLPELKKQISTKGIWIIVNPYNELYGHVPPDYIQFDKEDVYMTVGYPVKEITQKLPLNGLDTNWFLSREDALLKCREINSKRRK